MHVARTLMGIVITAALGAHMTPVQAGETLCVGLFDEIANGNLRVPAGEVCELEGAEVRGNITVEPHATLIAQGIRVGGNLRANDAELVSVSSRSTIGGNIHIVHGRVVNVIGVRVGGNVQLARIRDEIQVHRSSIGGNLQAVDSDGAVSISRNRINGNLQCSQNSLWPDGHDNIVRGNLADQCADL